MIRAEQQKFPRHTMALLTVALLGALTWLTPGTAKATTTSPEAAYRVTSTVSPSHLIPGDETGVATYVIRVVNSGGAKTDGTPITITDKLPEGVTVDPTPAGFFELHAFNDYQAYFSCDEGLTVTCEISEALEPGSTLNVFIPVDISSTAPSPAINVVTVSGGGPADASTQEVSPVTPEQAQFGFQSISTLLTDADGAAYSQAGGHPYSFLAHFQVNQSFNAGLEGSYPVRNSRVIAAKLPKGLVVNPSATKTRCTEAQFEASASTECPDSSAIGLAYPALNAFGFSDPAIVAPLYNLVPPPGTAAEFGFAPGGFELFIHVIGSVDAEGNYALTASAKDIPTYAQLSGLDVELWGQPTDPSHNARRGACAYPTGSGNCLSEFQDSPLLTMPSACAGPQPQLSVEDTPWQEPADVIQGSAPLTDPEGNAVQINGCNALEFKPEISSKATTNLADSPTGLDFKIHQPQSNHYEGLSTANLKNVKITLPEEMTLNPSAANGLQACTDAQIGYQPSGGQIHFSEVPQSCPDAAKLGTLEVNIPLLEEKLPGTIYLAKPYENPFGNLTAIYLAIESPQTGIVAKLAGKVEANPTSGQLTATFTENPQLPIEDIETHFFNGPRGALVTPLTCGTKETTTTMVPWSTPEGADANPSDSFQTQLPAGGSGNCPTSEANAPDKPSFTAGTEAPQAGAYSPFLLKLSREDGTQRLTGIDTTLPPGLTGKLAGIPYCSEAQIAQAKSREVPNGGALEQQSPSCPAASEVGSVTVGVGAGITPLYVGGHAYLAGPYKGAPLSLAILTPAVAGPFDLGAVVVRTALQVDPETARIHAVSDPLPSIIQGIPLDIRSIAVKLGRPSFTLNPTSCDPMAITGSAPTLTGQVASLTSPFQVGGCSALKFAPKLAISLKGGTKRHRFPALKAVLTYPKGNYANIASAQVTLPHGEFLEQAHIGTVCTRVQFAADSCPKASIYGKAKAITPLLDKPLEGPVYLRSSSHELPDLVAALNGQVDVVLAGRVDTGKGGGIRNTFEAVPDAPVSKFTLEMQGGKKGLLVNSENICRKPQKATVSFTAQNGKALALTPTIKNDCGKKAKKKGSKKGAGAKKGHGGKK